MSAFDAALNFTLAREGGYVNNPADHGGATNHGITQCTYDEWRGAHGLLPQDVRLITDAEVRGIYFEQYWSAAHCQPMSPPLAAAHFDWAVNHGVAGATRTLQEACGITADGVYGPHTAAAVSALDHDDLWREYNRLRRAWYRADVDSNPTQQQFLAGWLYRVDRLDAYCETLEQP